eukprot:IDg8611t1
MSISMKNKETVQEYSDRFTSLMSRTGKRDDDETLVAVYIDGFDARLQELMRVTRASQLTMWSRLGQGAVPVSIAAEIENAIALTPTRRTKTKNPSAETTVAANEVDKPGRENRKKCGKCKKFGHSTEEHRDRKPSPRRNADEAPKQIEKKCWTCTKPWKPGHKCKEEDRNPQSNNIELKQAHDSESESEEGAKQDRTFSDKLVASIMRQGSQFNTPQNALNAITVEKDESKAQEENLNTVSFCLNEDSFFGAQVADALFQEDINMNTTVLPPDSVPRSESMVSTDGLLWIVAQPICSFPRSSFVNIACLLLRYREPSRMGQETSWLNALIHGVPSKNPGTTVGASTAERTSVITADEEIVHVDGLTAKDLSEDVHQALTENQDLPLSSRCTHSLAPIDIRDSYFRFRVEESDMNWIAFKWKSKHYRFTCAPFGIKTMTAQFQMVMDKIFDEIPFVAVYVDDIVVFSKTRAEHIQHGKVRLLGFVVSGKGIEMDSSKSTVIANWEKPRTVQQLLRFLGAANYYRQFVP